MKGGQNSGHVPGKAWSGPPRIAAPTANKAVLAVALAAAANNGVDLLSGCRSLGLRCASILRKRVSNAIVCDFKKRISSIRRSSLSSTTLSSISIRTTGHVHSHLSEDGVRFATDICLARDSKANFLVDYDVK
jgi:hypothetical protein